MSDQATQSQRAIIVCGQFKVFCHSVASQREQSAEIKTQLISTISSLASSSLSIVIVIVVVVIILILVLSGDTVHHRVRTGHQHHRHRQLVSGGHNRSIGHSTLPV